MPEFQGLNDGEVLHQVRTLVRQGRVHWTLHIDGQMVARGYDRGMIKECLLTGHFVERPTVPNRSGPIQYEFRMRAIVDGDQMDVVASLIPEKRVVAITVMDPNS
jgi:hypothetical protein